MQDLLWGTNSGRVPSPGHGVPATAATARQPVIISPCVEFEFNSVAALATAVTSVSNGNLNGSSSGRGWGCVQQVLVSLDFCPWASFVSTRSPTWSPGPFLEILHVIRLQLQIRHEYIVSDNNNN